MNDLVSDSRQSGGGAEWLEPRLDAINAFSDYLLAHESGRIPETYTAGRDIGAYWKWRPEAADLQSEKLAFLLDHWRSLRTGGAAVRLEAIDPLDLKTVLGDVLLLDVLDHGFDARYRVYGTRVAELAGRDWTGFTVSEMNRVVKTDLSQFYRGVYRAAFQRSEPIFTQHNSPNWLSPSSWLRLILPLVNESGAVARFIVGNIPTGVKRLTKAQQDELSQRTRGFGASNSGS